MMVVCLYLFQLAKWESTKAHLHVQLKPIKCQSIIDFNITKPGRDFDLFPLKLSTNIPLDGRSQNHLANFTEFVI